MLQNNTPNKVTIKWGGKSVDVAPGATIAVENAFDLTPTEAVAIEARTINKFGLTRLSPGQTPTPAPQPPASGSGDAALPPVPSAGDARQLEDHTKDELLEIGQRLELPVKKSMTKEEMIALIRSAEPAQAQE